MYSRGIYFSLFNPDLNSDNWNQNMAFIVKGKTFKKCATVVKDTVEPNTLFS